MTGRVEKATTLLPRIDAREEYLSSKQRGWMLALAGGLIVSGAIRIVST